MGAVFSLPYLRLRLRRRASLGSSAPPPSPVQSTRTLVISHPRPLDGRPLPRRARTPSRRASARFKAYDRDARPGVERHASLREARPAREQRPRPRSFPPSAGLACLEEELYHLFEDDKRGSVETARVGSDESHETATESTATATTLSALEFLAGPALACTSASGLEHPPKKRALLTKHRRIEGGWDWVRAEDLSGWTSA
ncbi:hypothetical protein Q8F55_000518 [Vanrija albida]|uniref:Uncharacterized protein n=1 Tax=Vanrija albida TaxID=181172 RepID=A0ABR3QEG7_9TREE